MTHIYGVTGMSCSGCKAKVKQLLSEVEGVKNVSIDLPNGEAVIDMKDPISTDRLRLALKDYPKYQLGDKQNTTNGHDHPQERKPAIVAGDPHKGDSQGTYYCPMHCEGDKTYDKPGSCPVCGMNLEKVHAAAVNKKKYTCPMHPEIIRDAPGSCPICGMAWMPGEP